MYHERADARVQLNIFKSLVVCETEVEIKMVVGHVHGFHKTPVLDHYVAVYLWVLVALDIDEFDNEVDEDQDAENQGG